MAGIGKYEKGKAFSLKSGNNIGGRNGKGVVFKKMGSSPMKQPMEPTQTKYEGMRPNLEKIIREQNPNLNTEQRADMLAARDALRLMQSDANQFTRGVVTGSIYRGATRDLSQGALDYFKEIQEHYNPEVSYSPRTQARELTTRLTHRGRLDEKSGKLLTSTKQENRNAQIERRMELLKKKYGKVMNFSEEQLREAASGTAREFENKYLSQIYKTKGKYGKQLRKKYGGLDNPDSEWHTGGHEWNPSRPMTEADSPVEKRKATKKKYKK